MCEPPQSPVADGAGEPSKPATKGTGVFHGPGSFPRALRAGGGPPRRGASASAARPPAAGSWFSPDRTRSPHRSHSVTDFRASGSYVGGGGRPETAAAPHQQGRQQQTRSRSCSSSSDWMCSGRPGSVPHSTSNSAPLLHLQLDAMQIAESPAAALLPGTPGNSTSSLARGASGGFVSDSSVAAALAGVSELLLLGSSQPSSSAHMHSISPQLASPVCSMPAGSYHSAPVPIPVRPMAAGGGGSLAVPYMHHLTPSGVSPGQQLCASSMGGPACGGSPTSLLDSSPHMLLLSGMSGASAPLRWGGSSNADVASAAATLPAPLQGGGGGMWESAFSGTSTDCVGVDEATRRSTLELIDNELLQLMQLKQSLTAAKSTGSVSVGGGGAACFALAPPHAADVSGSSVAHWQLQHSQQDALAEAQAKLHQLATMQQLQSQLEAELLQLMPA